MINGCSSAPNMVILRSFCRVHFPSCYISPVDPDGLVPPTSPWQRYDVLPGSARAPGRSSLWMSNWLKMGKLQEIPVTLAY